MRRLSYLYALMAMLAFSPALTAVAQEASPTSEVSLLSTLGLPELRVTSDGVTNDLPTELAAGRYHVILENQGEVDIDLEFSQLAEGSTVEDVVAAFEEAESGPMFVPPGFFFEMVFNGGASTLAGETGDVILDLAPGEWAVNFYTYDPSTDESGNNFQTLNVTGEMPVVSDVEGAIPIVTAEMYFELPETLASGPQIWQVVNQGEQVHHVVLQRIPDGATEDQVLELVGSFFGPPASPDAGATPAEPALAFQDVEDVFFSLALSAGQTNWYDLDLEAGTYTMLCFLPDPSGNPHVMLGMIEVFTVA